MKNSIRVLSFGSLNIDYIYEVPHFVGPGETLASSAVGVFSGGKGLNQSIALSRALEKSDIEVFHAGAIGIDGVFLMDELRLAGVNTDYIMIFSDEKKRVNEEDDISAGNAIRTGHAIIQRTPSGDNSILLYGGANKAISKDEIDLVLSNFGEGDILLIQNEISKLDYLIEEAQKIGMTIILNPSPFEECLGELIHKVNYLILNEVEAEQLISVAGGTCESGDSEVDSCEREDCEMGACEIEDCEMGVSEIEACDSALKEDPKKKLENENLLLRSLREKYPEVNMILTLGDKGSLFLGTNSEEIIKVYAKEVNAVDTTGAGDTYTGYFVAGILSGKGPRESMEQASVAAAIAVTRYGAAPAIPTIYEVIDYKLE